jgi:hypothetical protein
VNPEQERFYAEALRLRAIASSAPTHQSETRLLIHALLNAAMAIAARDIPQPSGEVYVDGVPVRATTAEVTE